MRVALIGLFTIFFSVLSHAQEPDYRVLHLVSKILEKLPDASYTRQALGNAEDREARASAHAVAIVGAADLYRKEWENFAVLGGWHNFNTENDLPALIAAVAMHESSFRSVIRLDDNTILTKPIPKMSRADVGVLQVRAPSITASNCGVSNKDDIKRLIDDLDFAYKVGACVLTHRVSHFIVKYKSPAFTRLNRLERTALDGYFYGMVGPRKDTSESKTARDLIVIERYNWGDKDLYLHPLHSGYARRILREFEFFRMLKGTGNST